jgi:CBS-domain-containing membrane protein
MDKNFTPLATTTLAEGASFALPHLQAADPARLEDAAALVMTDFREVRAITTMPRVGMDQAYQRMIANGVRLLLVVDENNTIVGLITSWDVEGERPLQVMQSKGMRRAELQVVDVMTPAGGIDVLQLSDVIRARVGDIVATLQAMGRQHAMVVERDASSRTFVRGLFSAAQISRQVAMPVPTWEVARNFAQVEKLLTH